MGEACGQWEGHVLAKEGSCYSTSADVVLREWGLMLTDHILGQERELIWKYWGNEICRFLIFLFMNAGAPTSQSEEVSPWPCGLWFLHLQDFLRKL